MMWRGANFEVIDLGTNVAADRFVSAAREHGASLVGISALLTTTMVGMKDVVTAIRAAGLGDVKVIVGGRDRLDLRASARDWSRDCVPALGPRMAGTLPMPEIGRSDDRSSRPAHRRGCLANMDPIRHLSHDDMEAIHHAALRILERTGMWVDHVQALFEAALDVGTETTAEANPASPA